MDMSGLSLDQAPPYRGVYRFFLTAPVFAMLAALVVTFGGASLFSSFLNFSLIGVIHWLTLGFITMTMFGAATQMLPVLAGVKLKNPVIFAASIHFTLTSGALLLGASYVFSFKGLLPFAGVLVSFSVLMFSVRILLRLTAIKNASATIRAMRMSIASLMVVWLLGIYMLGWHMNWFHGLNVDLLSVHFLWAFVGWVGILVMGVSFQVIPMFYVSPDYHAAFRRFVPAAIVVLLVFYTIVTVSPLVAIPGETLANESTYVKKAIRIALYSIMAFYAVVTLLQIGRRKRKLPDPGLLFWKTSMIFLLVSSAMSTTVEFYGGAMFSKLILLTGMAFMIGFVFSAINGMMYKIVPFLSWFHLAGKGIFDVPTMRDMLDDDRVKLQFAFHLLLLFSLPVPLFYPHWGYFVTGPLFFISSFLLWLNLYTVIIKYNAINKKHMKLQA
jgi:hypothetical protein